MKTAKSSKYINILVILYHKTENMMSTAQENIGIAIEQFRMLKIILGNRNISLELKEIVMNCYIILVIL